MVDPYLHTIMNLLVYFRILMLILKHKKRASTASSLCTRPLQEIQSLPTKITNGLNSVGNYQRNIEGTWRIIFSTFLLQFTDGIPIKKLPTEVFHR